MDESPPAYKATNEIHPSVLYHLDPAFTRLYNDHIANYPPPPFDLYYLRQNYSYDYAFATGPAPVIGGIGETTVPGWEKYPGEIGVRVYIPPGEDGERKIWPVHFNFHGGAWALGDLSSDSHICHHISVKTPCTVIDVAYRLIPEYPFPIGIMDSLAAVKYILYNSKTFSVDASRVTLGGTSAGATVALTLNHLARDAGFGESIRGVVVGSPAISDLRTYTTSEQSPYLSMQQMECAPTLDWMKLKWFDALKWMSLASTDRTGRADVSWFADLMTAPNFKNLAPITWIGTAECDPLRDEGEAYADKLKENGNQAIKKRYSGVPHRFMHMDNELEQGRQYIDDIVTQIKKCLYA